ncbi:MAG: hypothetical protein II007_08795 [Gammaproteobacteria bacterium]|nr:hypothetical protein [Gammaproteobacteria bacterium]
MRLKLWRRQQPQAVIGIYLGNAEVAIMRQQPGQPAELISRPRKGPLPALLSELADEQWRNARCQLVLASGSYDLIAIDKPPVTDDELAGALPWAVRELTRRPTARLVTDYLQLASQPAGAEKIHVVCSDLDLLQPLVAAIHGSGAELVGISIEELAVVRLLEDKPATALLFQMAGDELLLVIARDGELHVMRRLRGYQQLASQNLDSHGPELVDGLAVELQRSMDYFELQLRQPPVKRVMLALPVDEPALLAEMLARNLAVPVQLLDEGSAPLVAASNGQRLALAATRLLEMPA